MASTRVPSLVPVAVVGDDPLLLAELSAVLRRKGSYLPCLNGPRVTRPDLEAEVIRRTNAIARARPERTILAGLPDATCDLLSAHLPARRTVRIASVDDLLESRHGIRRSTSELKWAKSSIGLGLLHALRGGHKLVFADVESSAEGVALDSDHIVVCEEGDDHAQVLAANYAYALNAGLLLIPAFPKDEAGTLLERLYSLYDYRGASPTDTLSQVKQRLRAHAAHVPLRDRTSLTFVTDTLPWGFAFPEVPSTHLFSYPSLGVSLINGIVAAQPDAPGVRTAVVIDPGSVDSKEVEVAKTRLMATGVLTKALRSSRATVYRAANTIRLFPYDLLLISTHCTDVEGERVTYEFVDSEGRQRTLITDEAVAFEIKRAGDDVKVTEFIRFVSLDGIDWNDPERPRKLYVGSAIRDFMDGGKRKSLTPVARSHVPRVEASMALHLADGNFIPLPESIASEGTPLIINNACASWHRLASNYSFVGARGYIGTLFSVTDSEAQDVVGKLFDKYYGKELAVAIWRSQTDTYGSSVRRPYVLVGCHFQRMRTRPSDQVGFVLNELAKARNDWQRRLAALPAEATSRKDIEAIIEFLQQELRVFVALRKREIQERRGIS